MIYRAKFMLVAILMAVSTVISAQESVQTLFGENGAEAKFSASLSAGYSGFNGGSLMNCGLDAGLVINGRFRAALRAGGNITSPVYTGLDPLYDEGIFRSLLGGVTFEPIFYGNRMVHFSVPVSVGGGVAGYLTTSRYSTITPGGDTKMKRRVIDSDALFFAEPAIKGEINLTTSIRLYATVGWMLTGGLDLVNTGSNQMNGLTLQGGITLGRR